MNPAVLVLLAALSLTVFLTGLASGARRLLGISIGKGRAVLTAGVGLATGTLISRPLRGVHPLALGYAPWDASGSGTGRSGGGLCGGSGPG
ncbi:hypothetical protein ACFWNU_16705 [Streptomyces sp. NPDC058427]|uniref:hypothetical protein n=1 Tax=Streptomyces sp. NPDC058427 TaxID=3346494 RepID=UPI0036611B2A